jgi:hypothetical protein
MEKSMDDEKLMPDDFVAKLNKLKIEKGDVLIFRIPKNFNPPQHALKQLTKYVSDSGGYILFAAKHIQVEHFSEEKMNKMGWYRKDKNADSKD